ncbi:penicillin acylase family protein [Paracoccus sp. (in: a-proteobacteria)]|uniref:penicillin acylase family protein n=1 Tax=Paracoccus sp. TaxID=267 RepID=UPI0035B07F04
MLSSAVGLGLSPALAPSRVEVIRNDRGVPHVYADDTHGVYTGFGYAVAQDRLFQMEMARRSVLGTVAEVSAPITCLMTSGPAPPSATLTSGRRSTRCRRIGARS